MTRPTGAIRMSFFALMICFAARFAQARPTVVVGTCNNSYPQYGTIQAAVNASPAGGLVLVCPGVYPEQVKITQSLTINGILTGADLAPILVPPTTGLVANGNDIFGNPVAAQIFANSPGAGANVTLGYLTIDGIGNNLVGCTAPKFVGIYYQNTSGGIAENVIRNQYQSDFALYGRCNNGFAIDVESTSNSTVVTVTANSIRSYQKNGVTVSGAATGTGSQGPVVSIVNNNIVGLAATRANWSTPGAIQNGVQVGFGATGKVLDNVVADNIWSKATASAPRSAAAGILIFSSSGLTVTGNIISSAQFGIVAETDGVGVCGPSTAPVSCGPADGNAITTNKIVGTQLFDGIDVCSNSNNVQTNTIYGSAESAVHIDDGCTNSTLGTTSGNINNVSQNIINETCAGVLTGTGTGNIISPNTTYNAVNLTLAGDTCTGAGLVRTAGQSSRLRASPYNPLRR